MKKTALILMLSMCSILAMYAGGAEESFVEGIFKYEIDGVHGTGDSVKVSVVQDSINTGFHLPDSVLHVPASVIHDGRQYGVRAIKRGGLSGCSCIKKLIIDEGIKVIENESFNGCFNLESTTIPATVDSVGNDLFSECERLRKITVDRKNPVYDSRKGCNAIIETKENLLLVGCQTTVIPSSIVCIVPDAFVGCLGLTEMRIPEGVERICEDAFVDCPDLTSIYISSTVHHIGQSIFRNCPRLARIVVDEKNEEYDSRNNCNAIINTPDSTLVVGCCKTVIPEGLKEIGQRAFSYCSKLMQIVIPDGITYIADFAFEACSNLQFISLPQSLEYIGMYAFNRCASLDSIYIPRDVYKICRNPFWGCTSLRSIVVDTENKAYDSRQGCNAIIETEKNCLMAGCVGTVIPDGIREISEMEFSTLPLTKIFIPKSIEKIGHEAFRYLPSCVSIQVDKDNPVYDSRDNCNAIIETATNKLVYGCRRTDISESVRIIGENAICEMDLGYYLIIPEGVETIEEHAISSPSLHFVVLPRSIRHISTHSFSFCKNLEALLFKGDMGNVELTETYYQKPDYLKPILEAQWKKEKKKINR